MGWVGGWSRPGADAYDPPMRCNIDAKGKAVRLAAGVITMLAGLAAAASPLVIHGTDERLPFVGFGIAAIGGFMIFEGWSGWCVVRAMGVRTRI